MPPREDPPRRFEIRPQTRDEWDEVATLIHDSTNAWYEAQGCPKIFVAGPRSTRLFCEVYEALDPGCCLVASDLETGRLAASCFYHPRPTHVSLGIMNVHPDYFCRGLARRLLRAITDMADEARLPTRLVSSAWNLDSFSLYNRSGFVPRAVYQDMLITVPESGLPDSPLGPGVGVHQASLEDVGRMQQLEHELVGLDRQKDFRFCCENRQGIWQTLVRESAAGELDGFVISIRHPASNMIGPGVMRSEETAIELVRAALNHHRGHQALIVTPTTAAGLVDTLYHWGARNCELHLAQVRGHHHPSSGIVIPTFMPETG